MEHTFPELLTRENMLRILQKQRQLKIPENELSDEELVKIFKSFAVPLAKRERRRNTNMQTEASTSLAMEIDDPNEISLDTPVKMAFLNMLIENKLINSTEKRHLDSSEDDDSLTLATKRIKITWP